MKWEYAVETLDLVDHANSYLTRLDELGKQGWELVSVVNPAGVDLLVAFLKRPIPN